MSKIDKLIEMFKVFRSTLVKKEDETQYHIYARSGGQLMRITDQPMTYSQIHFKFHEKNSDGTHKADGVGGVKRLENSGHVIKPVK